MKNCLFFVILSMFSLTSIAQNQTSQKSSDITTYYFIRHAEKDKSNPDEQDPHLKQEGLNRATHWSEILGNIKFDAVYSSNYKRTKETAQPTAYKNNIDISIYDPNNTSAIEAFLNDTQGQNVLIVGHSNTIPKFVNAVIKEKKYEDIDDSNNGNLYIVTIIGDQIVDQVLTIN